MIEQLFGSKTRVKLLHLFYSNPNRSFYVREITRKIDEQINSVRRELSNLLKVGIIKSDTSGNKLYYEVNQAYQFYEPLKQIFSHLDTAKTPVVKTAGGSLAEKIQDLGSIELALLTGVFVRSQAAPVDLLIVGDVNRNKLEKLVTDLEAEEGQELRYAVFSPQEFEYRRGLNDRFLATVLNAKSTVLIDHQESEPKREKTAAGAKTANKGQ